MRLLRPLAERAAAGPMYDNGRGVPKDYGQALAWFRKAAEQGYEAAQNDLGVMYALGQGVPQDYVQAHMWFNLAGSHASDAETRGKAIKNCDEAAAKMTPDQIAEAIRSISGKRLSVTSWTSTGKPGNSFRSLPFLMERISFSLAGLGTHVLARVDPTGHGPALRRLLHLGDPGLQHDEQHGEAHPQHAVVLRPVRARDHGRANPRQGRRLEPQRHLDGRSGSARLSNPIYVGRLRQEKTGFRPMTSAVDLMSVDAEKVNPELQERKQDREEDYER